MLLGVQATQEQQFHPYTRQCNPILQLASICICLAMWVLGGSGLSRQRQQLLHEDPFSVLHQLHYEIQKYYQSTTKARVKVLQNFIVSWAK